LTKVFGLDMMFSPADQRSSGDRIRRSVGISHCSWVYLGSYVVMRSWGSSFRHFVQLDGFFGGIMGSNNR